MRAWSAKLVEIERKRDRYQEMFAAEAMNLAELQAKLGALEETRETAERELWRRWRANARGSKRWSATGT